MFIPRSTPLHENLSTSFVLVDALVEDLCEGGFSGVIEILLRQTDCAVVVSKGKVIAAAENQSSGPKRSSVPELGVRARTERGRVSVYNCSNETALAIAGRMFSESLYNRLSTEFADLDKMISKLGREKDREWFVDIETGGGLAGLVHIKDHQFRAVTSSVEAPEGTRALQKLLEECKKTGATFDVYYRPANEPLEARAESASEPAPEAAQPVAAEPTPPIPPVEPKPQPSVVALEAVTTPAPAPQPTTEAEPPQVEAEEARASEEREEPAAVFKSLASEPAEQGSKAAAAAASAADSDFNAAEFEVKAEMDEPPGEIESQLSIVEAPGLDVPADFDLESIVAAKPERLPAPTPTGGNQRVPATRMLAPDEVAMFEVKRLMAEIASTIENAARVIEPRDTFSIYLRAGQLKIADRYPFLDPFGNEFEYIAGEIVFVGEEKPEVFIEGLTEALRLAVISIVEASAQPANLRTRIEDELYSLLEKERAQLKRLKLDAAIETIIG